MSGDLVHAQHRIHQIPDIVSKQHINTILLLGTWASELLHTLQQKFPNMPIEFFDDKKSKSQSDAQVDYSIREKYKHQRVLVIDETFNVWQWAKNIKRLVNKYPFAYAYYLALTSTWVSSQAVVMSLSDNQFICDVDTQADRTESLTLYHYNFYTRELWSVLEGRSFNDTWDRRLIDYICALSNNYLNSILLQNKQLSKHTLSQAIDTFLDSPLGKGLLRARPQEVYHQIIQYIHKDSSKLIECVNTLFSYKDVLSNSQITSILHTVHWIIQLKKYIEHHTFKKQLTQLITEKDLQSYEATYILCRLGEFALAEQRIQSTPALQKRDFSWAINAYKEYAKKEIEQLCEYGAIPAAYKIQKIYFPQDTAIIHLIQQAEKEQKRKDTYIGYDLELISTDSIDYLPQIKWNPK